jgi:hypothetical protein
VYVGAYTLPNGGSDYNWWEVHDHKRAFCGMLKKGKTVARSEDDGLNNFLASDLARESLS